MGKVIILPETTKDPISLIGRRAGVCYGSDIADEQKNYKRGLKCLEDNHGRTLEYVNIETIIDNYSARVVREWYTHLAGAPTRLQSSTRYIDYEHGFDFITPNSIKAGSEAEEVYLTAMAQIVNATERLAELGIPKEDSANLLPLGMTTKIVDKRNLRNVIDMTKNRLCSRAYWEYRMLMRDYINALRDYSDEWKVLIDEYKIFQSKCDFLGYCPEGKSCGKYPKKDIEG